MSQDPHTDQAYSRYVRGYKAPLPLFYSSSKIPSVQPASAHQRASTTATYNPQHIPPTTKMPGAVVGNATRIWELNVHWDLYSQCGIWDARGRGVDIWECIQPHDSTPGTQPPNAHYWRYVARR